MSDSPKLGFFSAVFEILQIIGEMISEPEHLRTLEANFIVSMV